MTSPAGTGPTGPPVDAALAAAIVAAVMAARAAAGSAEQRPDAAPDRWSAPESRLRRPLSPGPDAWRFSLR